MDITKDKIEKLFGESIYETFKEKRYGIKSCRRVLDPEYLFRVKELYTYKKERFDCDLDNEDCSYNKIKELINTL